jgi:hypothetical protein
LRSIVYQRESVAHKGIALKIYNYVIYRRVVVCERMETPR